MAGKETDGDGNSMEFSEEDERRWQVELGRLIVRERKKTHLAEVDRKAR